MKHRLNVLGLNIAVWSVFTIVAWVFGVRGHEAIAFVLLALVVSAVYFAIAWWYGETAFPRSKASDLDH